VGETCGTVVAARRNEDARRGRFRSQRVDLVRVIAGHLGEHIWQQCASGDRRSIQQRGTPR
jgi:hypothetical protein